MKLNLLKSIEPGGKADYGLDSPQTLRNYALQNAVEWALTLFFPIKFKNQKINKWLRLGLLLSAAGRVITIIVLYYGSKQQKFKQRDKLLSLAELRPDARVLDLGAGRGLLAIGAAKRSPGIKVTAVDTWLSKELTGNSEEALRSNIDLEEVGGRVHVYEADARKLPFEKDAFDLVLSNRYLHTIGANTGVKGVIGQSYRQQERAKALDEIARVLAPGGRAVLSDSQFIDEAAAELTRLGLAVTVHGPFRNTVPAQKILIADKQA